MKKKVEYVGPKGATIIAWYPRGRAPEVIMAKTGDALPSAVLRRAEDAARAGRYAWGMKSYLSSATRREACQAGIDAVEMTLGAGGYRAVGAG